MFHAGERMLMSTMPKRLIQCTAELWRVLDSYADGEPLNPKIEELLWSHPEVEAIAIKHDVERAPRSKPGPKSGISAENPAAQKESR